MSRVRYFDWWARGRRAGRRPTPSPHEVRHLYRRSLRFEPLEDRRMLALVTVTNDLDVVNGDTTSIANLLVNDGGDGIALREAIEAANMDATADMIDFDDGLDGGTILLTVANGDLDITEALTIDASSLMGGVTIDANDPTSGIKNGDGIRIFDIDDGDVFNEISVEIKGLKLVKGDVSGNGGAIRSLENVVISSMVLLLNAASGNGGAIWLLNDGTTMINESLIIGNRAGDNGGGIWSDNFDLGTTTIANSIIENNFASLGGGIWLRTSSGTTVITDSTITGNSASSGGGVYARSTLSGTTTIMESTVSGNSASSNGGGIRAVTNDSTTTTFSNNTISGNTAGSIGGGIHVDTSDSAATTISNSSISGNTANGNGGGIHSYTNSSTATTISNSSISGNTANTDGGGMYAGTAATSETVISESSIFANDALGDGGGIKLEIRGTTTIRQSTISGNEANVLGGGVYANGNLAGSSSLTIEHSTITRNIADADFNLTGSGGGVFSTRFTGAASFLLDHTIVAVNADTSDTGPDLLSSGNLSAEYSLIGNNLGTGLAEAPIGFPDANGNLIGEPLSGGVIDPLLGPLADNGGPTLTHALLPQSPAIDAGDPAFDPNAFVPPLDFDQRGTPFARQFGRVDMGAYEFVLAPVAPGTNLLVDQVLDESDGVVSVGDLSLREALILSNTSAGVQTIGFDSSLDGQKIDLVLGQLQVTDSTTIDASSLTSGLTIDAGDGTDTTPGTGDGIRIFNIDDGNLGTFIDVEIIELTLTGGDVSLLGGAIDSRENLSITGSTISENSAGDDGGGIFSGYGDLTMTDSTISGNSAGSDGGGIFALRGTMTITDSMISGNSAGDDGGGIFNDDDGDSTLSVAGSTISGNRAGDDGGGIYSRYGDLTVTGSTISGNSASGGNAYGGGIFSRRGELTVTRSTISDNSTSGSNAGGGGIFNNSGLTIIQHSTITANIAPAGRGSGVASSGNDNTQTEVSSSIIAGNTRSDVDVVVTGAINSFVSGGYNLIGTSSSTPSGLDNFTATGDQTGVTNPMLDPLADNGGPTQTHALLPGSLAIDAGDPNFTPPPDFDQRGDPFARVADGGVDGLQIDIGAFELQPIPSAFFGDYNLNGTVDAADYTVWRDTLGSNVAPYSGADGSGNGVIDQDDYDVWKANFGNTLPPPGSGSGTLTAAASGQLAPPPASGTVLASSNALDSGHGQSPFLSIVPATSTAEIAQNATRVTVGMVPRGQPKVIEAADQEDSDLLLASLGVEHPRVAAAASLTLEKAGEGNTVDEDEREVVFAELGDDFSAWL